MPSLTRKVGAKTRMHEIIVDRLRARILLSKKKLSDTHDKWTEAEERVLAYLPERDLDIPRRNLREDGLPQYTTIQIPYSYAVLMASHTYWTSVFLSRNPIFQFDGRHGETQQQVQALEAIISYQVFVGGILPTIYTWLYDAGKYGAGIVGVMWEEIFEQMTEIKEEPQYLGNSDIVTEVVKKQVTSKFRTYSGNKLYNVRPHHFLFDPRVTLSSFQEGEFCAVYKQLSWNQIKRREAQGYYMNVDQIKPDDRHVTFEEVNVGSEQLGTPDAMAEPMTHTDERPQKHPAVVGVYETYVEIIPSEWGLSNSSFPEKWVFTVTADLKLLIGVQPLGALHAKFPFQVLEVEPEGYSIVSRGIPQILEPVQNTLDWLINSHFYNVRAALNNQYLVDPSKVVMKDVLDPLPGGIIRLKPEAYGQDLKTIMMQLPVADVTQNHMRDMQNILNIGERVIGVNDQILGVMPQGGRKTATEVRTSSGFGVNRLRTIAEYFSATGFSPLSQMLVQNTQQYMDMPLKIKIAGSLVPGAGAKFVQVDPTTIAGFYDFVPVDGTLPVDRFAQANLWKEILNQLRQFPQLLMQYDVGKIFEWTAQLAGLKNIDQFKLEIMPDANMMAAAQAGNSVPLQQAVGSPANDLSKIPTRPAGQTGPTG